MSSKIIQLLKSSGDGFCNAATPGQSVVESGRNHHLKMNHGEIVRRVPYKKKGINASMTNQSLSTAKKVNTGIKSNSIVPTFEVNLLKSAGKSVQKEDLTDGTRRYASPKPTNTLPR